MGTKKSCESLFSNSSGLSPQNFKFLSLTVPEKACAQDPKA
jgi:hypothetical protein